jgi:hypothetical protein
MNLEGVVDDLALGQAGYTCGGLERLCVIGGEVEELLGLELLGQDELNSRDQRLIEKRRKDAGFRDTRTLEDFGWPFNPSLKRAQFYQFATGAFVRERRVLIFLGPLGWARAISFRPSAWAHLRTV